MQTKRRRRHKYAAPIGGASVLLAVIGVVTVIVLSLQLTGRVLDNSREKKMFEDIVRPVMMFDPVAFESPADIEPTRMLLYSMWAALTSERARNYAYNDSQELMIPASDLDVAAAALFAGDIKLEHQTFADYEMTYYVYDAEKKMYGVRVTSQLFVYSPEVRDIVKEGEYYKLDVYYIPPGNAWSTTFAGKRFSTTMEKHMYYYMVQSKDSYHIAKLVEPPSESAEVAE